MRNHPHSPTDIVSSCSPSEDVATLPASHRRAKLLVTIDRVVTRAARSFEYDFPMAYKDTLSPARGFSGGSGHNENGGTTFSTYNGFRCGKAAVFEEQKVSSSTGWSDWNQSITSFKRFSFSGLLISYRNSCVVLKFDLELPRDLHKSSDLCFAERSSLIRNLPERATVHITPINSLVSTSEGLAYRDLSTSTREVIERLLRRFSVLAERAKYDRSVTKW